VEGEQTFKQPPERVVFLTGLFADFFLLEAPMGL
jgi:hypothetical protein